MDRDFVPKHVFLVNSRRPLRAQSRAARSGCEVAFALTKEVFWFVGLLASLGLWAAMWAAAGSLAFAWLQ